MKKLCYILFTCVLFMGCIDDEGGKRELPQNYMVSKTLDSAVLGQSWEILEKAQQLADSGSGMDDVLELLPEHTQIMVNNNSLVYFLDGSVPMLVSFETPSKITKGGGGQFNIKGPSPNPNIIAVYPLNLMTQNSQEVNVIGSERDEEERLAKKALIIAGDPKFFGEHDDALAAKEYLDSSYNFSKGQVDYVSRGQLTLETYKQFAPYDLVHLSTHGERLCGYPYNAGDKIEVITAGESNFCGTVVHSGVQHGLTAKEEMQDFYLDPKNSDYVGNVILGWTEFYLKPSFFSAIYSDTELNDKIWIFSACEIGQRSDLAQTMENLLENGHFFYWLNTVDASDAYLAFQKFYENLAFEGLDAEKAFEKIPFSLRKNLPSSFDNIGDEGKDSIITTTELLHLKTGNPRHGIETVQLLHPVEETILQSGDNYPLDGEFGDGQPETLVVKLDLLGYTRSEFETQGMTISLKVDDHTVLGDFSFLPDDLNDAVSLKKIPKKEYGVRVHFEGLEIPDISPEKETMELRAYLHFNGENYSIHSEEVNINPKDVKIRANTPNGAVTITYDNDTGGIKYEAPNIPGGHTFSDDSGYMYAHVPREGGWKKLNLNNFMGQNMAQMMGQMMPVSMDVDILMGREGISTETPEMPQGNPVFKPMVDWPEKMTIANLSRSPNFKKRKTNCLSSKGDCVAFTGISGNAKGVQIHFNASGKMQRITIKGHRLDYEYGDYTVILPQAQELKLPF